MEEGDLQQERRAAAALRRIARGELRAACGRELRGIHLGAEHADRLLVGGGLAVEAIEATLRLAHALRRHLERLNVRRELAHLEADGGVALAGLGAARIEPALEARGDRAHVAVDAVDGRRHRLVREPQLAHAVVLRRELGAQVARHLGEAAQVARVLRRRPRRAARAGAAVGPLGGAPLAAGGRWREPRGRRRARGRRRRGRGTEAAMHCLRGRRAGWWTPRLRPCGPLPAGASSAWRRGLSV